MKPFIEKDIFAFRDEVLTKKRDLIATEVRLRVLVNRHEAFRLYCSPIMVRELVVGFIMTEGIIEGSWCAERMSIEYSDDEVLVDIAAEGRLRLDGKTITSGCVGGVVFERDSVEPEVRRDITVSAETLIKLFKRFQKASELYDKTGCIHSAALSDARNIIVMAEDIGRHNAVDKIIGYSVLEDISLSDKIMLVSGRLSSEMAMKCSRWAVPIIVSRTAPTSRTIDIAQKRGITIVGFMRGRRFNIYTNPERIEVSQSINPVL